MSVGLYNKRLTKFTYSITFYVMDYFHLFYRKQSFWGHNECKTVWLWPKLNIFFGLNQPKVPIYCIFALYVTQVTSKKSDISGEKLLWKIWSFSFLVKTNCQKSHVKFKFGISVWAPPKTHTNNLFG